MKVIQAFTRDLDTGYWTPGHLDTGHLDTLDTGYQILDTGYWILDTWTPGHWIVPGHK